MPQVDADDELSDSQEEAPGIVLPKAVPMASMPRSYIGLPMGTPLHQRTSGPSMSEQQIVAILQGQQLAQPLRPAGRKPPPEQRLSTHGMPISVAPSKAYVGPLASMTLQAPPDQPNISYTRAVQAVELTRKMREERRREREGQSWSETEPAIVAGNFYAVHTNATIGSSDSECSYSASPIVSGI